MLRLFCVLLYLVVVGSFPPDKSRDDSRIMNGKMATEGQFPFAVSLQEYGEEGDDSHQHICTISLITSKTCLGAAHCVAAKGKEIHPNKYCGIVGSVHQNENLDCYNYASVYAHEKYNSETQLNDIALFIFANPVDVGGDVNTVQIAGPGKQIAGEGVTVVGWGVTKIGGTASEKLRYTFLNVRDTSLCEDKFGDEIAEEQVCMSGDNTGTCEGDSGGPIVLTSSNTQIALVSFGLSQCDTEPSVNTDVRKYVGWIQEHADGEPVVIE